MKKYKSLVILFLINLIFLSFDSMAQNDLDERAIYIVRHAEKEINKDDPPLTKEGEKRAEKLREILKEKDIKSVYSSDKKRTRHTIIPFADEKGLHINIYDTDEHGELVTKIQEEEGNVVIIGHSNTVHHIINLLIGGQIMEELDESDYENIFVVYINEEGGTRLEKKTYSDFE